jgi:hypothetical protein
MKLKLGLGMTKSTGEVLKSVEVSNRKAQQSVKRLRT